MPSECTERTWRRPAGWANTLWRPAGVWEEGSIPAGQRRLTGHSLWRWPTRSPAQQRLLLLCCWEQNKQLGGVSNYGSSPQKNSPGDSTLIFPQELLLSYSRSKACRGQPVAQVTSSGIGVLPSMCQPGPIRANPGVFTSATRQEMPSLAGHSSEVQNQKMGRGCQAERETQTRQAPGSEASV